MSAPAAASYLGSTAGEVMHLGCASMTGVFNQFLLLYPSMRDEGGGTGVLSCVCTCSIAPSCSFFTAAHRKSSFDVILSGMVPGSAAQHSVELLAEVARILKPGGRLLLKEPVVTESGERLLLPWRHSISCED